MTSPRTILMLQGHPSLFWRRLAAGLEAAGHKVLKVHFCSADWVFWMRPGAVSYRGRFDDWPAWLDGFLARENVTDILYYADRLPYHVAARQTAAARSVKCWAVEFGYLRPDWLTFEPEAMGAGSLFPKSPEAVRALADGVGPPDMAIRFRHSFRREAFWEVTYNLIQAYGRPFYPRYFSDKTYWPAIDYLSWLVELAKSRGYAREAAEVEAWAEGGADYTLVAMQLQQDYQIRASSPFAHLETFLDQVIGSFAAHAAPTQHLVFKIHPLDNGLERWPRRIARLADRYQVADRIKVIRGGDLGVLLRASKGVVLVNSTVGLHAIQSGTPVIALGTAIFDMAGLTHQDGLDSFWTGPAPVDQEFAAVFRRALSTIQIKGSFFDSDGQRAAIEEIVRRMGATD